MTPGLLRRTEGKTSKAAECPECGGLMPAAKLRGRKRKYCSDACQNSAWVKMHPRTAIVEEAKQHD